MLSSPSLHEFATIDLGSNSFHLIVARIVNGSIQILSRIKRRVRLADGLDADLYLSQEAIERGVACLALFADRLKGFSPDNVKVIGTYTLRQAVNNAEFLAQAKKVFPFPIQIVSGEEEARLIYSGVSHTQPERGRKLVIDIGGGSTEMVIGDDFTPIQAKSRNMGCVSFAKQFFPKGLLNKAYFELAYNSAMQKISDLAQDYQMLGWQHVLGSSGTIKTVQNVLIANGYSDGEITEKRLQKLVENCLQFTSLEMIEMKGLLKERADVFVPGLAILLALFRTFRIHTMRYSNGAIREGVMYGLEKQFQQADIRHRTYLALHQQFSLDNEQAERVKYIALQLFEQVNTWRNQTQMKELREILKWASLFHEIGLVVNHQNIHRHSAYIINHMELAGFDSEQKNLLAMLIRYHLKAFKRSEIQSTYRYQHQDLLILVRLFRLATLLNRARQATLLPTKLELHISDQEWKLQFEDNFLKNQPLVLADLQEEQQCLATIGLNLHFA